MGTLDRGPADPLHGHVRRPDDHSLQPLFGRHLPRHPALRRHRLRARRRERLPAGIHRRGPVGALGQEFRPFVLQRIRLRRHLPGVALPRTAAIRQHRRTAAATDTAAGRPALPAHVARSRRRRRGSAPPGLYDLLHQLGRRRRVPGPAHGPGRPVHHRKALRAPLGSTSPEPRPAGRHFRPRSVGAALFPLGHLRRRDQIPDDTYI